ncbi:cytochrome P450 [Penicillium concentricum]|uniref:Cytochrome P450 n=1 Tax=Penicillium concentricum TaxID=293559 RepID=A0A9W9RRV3_9EURO|nr:cytochrome P450 [Penicillium concentricum]KAJ5365242.1 cytochrome P450 [Penicillium concentricum]
MASLHMRVSDIIDHYLSSYSRTQKMAVLVISLLVLFAFVQTIITSLKLGLRSIPGPFIARFSPLYRAWKIAKGNAPEFYLQLHSQYGHIVRTGPNTVDISDPKAIPTIYGISSKFLKSPFYETLNPSYENETMPSMFSVRDPVQHQALRRPVAQKFSMSSIKALEPLVDECTKIFIDSMRDFEGQCVDLGVWLQWYAFDVIGAITFQHHFGFLEKRKDIEGMIGALDNGLMYAGIVGQVPTLHRWLMGNRWVARILTAQPFVEVLDPLRTIVQFTQRCIDDYDRKPSEHDDRPDFLAWLRSEEAKGKPMPNRDMINHLSNNLLAGSDTTAISLRAIIYFLVQNGSVYHKLQREIDEADRTGKLSEYITYAECLELPYLQAVMKEAMRCHPGVSFPLERVVPEGGITLCGVHLGAGTVVGINPAVIHHDKTIFGEDASVFRPERWTESDNERIKLMDRHLMTFGYGSRTCIGKNISIMEMGKFVPKIIRHFELEWASDMAEWHVETFWFAKQHGLKCRLRSRAK